MTDREFVDLIETLDAAVGEVAGAQFRETPFRRAPGLESTSLRGLEIWIKNETENVSGSHKGRHLMGVLIWLEMVRALKRAGTDSKPSLAVMSCGNAALAAGMLAKASQYPLDAFVPDWADSEITRTLERLGTGIVHCEREIGAAGDPSYRRFVETVEDGAVPFTCQGPENALTIEGGQTLTFEIISSVLRGEAPLPNHLIVQVGGGALASSCVRAFDEAEQLGLIESAPRIHTVQTMGAYPLRVAYESLVERILDRHPRGSEAPSLSGPFARAAWLREHLADPVIDEEIHYAATHRSEFMRPWPDEPTSIADAILDDETYDWLAIVRGMLRTGGVPLAVSEARLAQAHRLARSATDISVDPTGTAGLAGCLQAAEMEAFKPGEKIALLFTGTERT